MSNTPDPVDLSNFVLKADFPSTVWYTGGAERDAAEHGIEPKRIRVVRAEDIAKLRTDTPKKNEPEWMTPEDARAVLPASYRQREIDGDVYPALNHPTTVEIVGYTAEQVAQAREQLAEHRRGVEAARQRRVEDRAAWLQRWVDGEDGLSVTFHTVKRGRYGDLHHTEVLI